MSTRPPPPTAADRRPDGARAATPRRGPGEPLDLLLRHLRGLIDADGAAFLVIDAERRSIEAAAEWFGSATVRDAIEPALRGPGGSGLPILIEAAIGRGTPLFLPRVEDWEAGVRLRAQFELERPEPAVAWEAFAGASLIACPVRTATGRTLGVLVVAALDPAARLRRSDLRVVELLADLAALTLERSELLRAEAARARQVLSLKRAAEDMSRSLESDEVSGRVVEHAAGVIGADHALLSRLVPGTSDIEVVAGSLPEEDRASEQSARVEVARTRAAVVEGRRMHAPVALGPRLFGILSVARASGPDFGPGQLEVLQELARLAAGAIANAIDFGRERRIARALTRGFVPDSLPEVEGFELGLLSEPADSHATGGDLYGVWPLRDGDVAVLVGDVAGKGVQTAALSAMARFFIEARSWGCGAPAAVLEQANMLLRNRLPGDTFVTAFFGILGADGLRYANAGHLAPLLLRASGAFEEIAGGGLPLGVEDAPGFAEHRIDFRPGDLMLAFTDGLLEARHRGELFGPERFAAALATASARAGDLDLLVRLVHDEVHEWAGGLSDDAVLLAVRRRVR